MIRSYLFTPAHQAELVARAHDRGGADAVVLDLKGSVPPEQKSAAREALGGAAWRSCARRAAIWPMWWCG